MFTNAVAVNEVAQFEAASFAQKAATSHEATVIILRPTAHSLSPLEALAVADGFMDEDGFFTMSDDEFLNESRFARVGTVAAAVAA